MGINLHETVPEHEAVLPVQLVLATGKVRGAGEKGAIKTIDPALMRFYL